MSQNGRRDNGTPHSQMLWKENIKSAALCGRTIVGIPLSLENEPGSDDEGLGRRGGEMVTLGQNQQVCGGEALVLTR